MEYPNLSAGIEVVVPDPSELLIEGKVKCPFADCSIEVRSSSCLAFHLKKHQAEGAIDILPKEASKAKINTIFYCPCTGCGRSRESGQFFYTKSQLKAHYNLMHVEKTYSCSQCGKRYGMESSLRRHERECGFRFSCSVCGQSFNMRNSLHMHMKRKGHLPGYVVTASGGPPQHVDVEMEAEEDEEMEGEAESVGQQLVATFHSNGSPIMNSSTDEPSSTHVSTATPSPQEAPYSPVLDHVNGVTSTEPNSTPQNGKDTILETEPSFSGVQTIVTQVSVEEDYQSLKHKMTAIPTSDPAHSSSRLNCISPPRTLALPVTTQSGYGTPPQKKPLPSAVIFNASSPDQEGYLFKCSTCSKVYTKRNSVYVHQHRKGHKGNVVRLKATDVQIVSDGDGFSLKSPLPPLHMAKPTTQEHQPRINGPVHSSTASSKVEASTSHSLLQPQKAFEDLTSRHLLSQLADKVPVSYPPRSMTVSAINHGSLVQSYTSEQIQALHQQVPKQFQPSRNLVDNLGVAHKSDKLLVDGPHTQSSTLKQFSSAGDIFKCPKCHKTYNSPGALITHNRDAHCEVCFKCNDCDKVYWFRNSLLAHQKRKNHSGCTKIAADVQSDVSRVVHQKADSIEGTSMEPNSLRSPESIALPILPTAGPNFLSSKWEIPTREGNTDSSSDNTQYVVIPVVAPLNQTLSAYPQFSLLPPTSKRKRPQTRITEEELVLSRKVQTADASCQTDNPSPFRASFNNVALQTDRFLINSSLSSVQVQTSNDLPSTCVTDLLDLGTQTEWRGGQNMDELLDFGTQTPSLFHQTDHASQTALY